MCTHFYTYGGLFNLGGGGAGRFGTLGAEICKRVKNKMG